LLLYHQIWVVKQILSKLRYFAQLSNFLQCFPLFRKNIRTDERKHSTHICPTFQIFYKACFNKSFCPNFYHFCPIFNYCRSVLPNLSQFFLIFNCGKTVAQPRTACSAWKQFLKYRSDKEFLLKAAYLNNNACKLFVCLIHVSKYCGIILLPKV